MFDGYSIPLPCQSLKKSHLYLLCGLRRVHLFPRRFLEQKSPNGYGSKVSSPILTILWCTICHFEGGILTGCHSKTPLKILFGLIQAFFGLFRSIFLNFWVKSKSIKFLHIGGKFEFLSLIYIWKGVTFILKDESCYLGSILVLKCPTKFSLNLLPLGLLLIHYLNTFTF